MAEKEERIVFLKTKPKGECPCQIDKDYCKETCWVKGKCSLGMTRSEAIERMAKALHRYSVRISNMEKDFDKLNAEWRKSFYNYAEAALNALLEE